MASLQSLKIRIEHKVLSTHIAKRLQGTNHAMERIAQFMCHVSKELKIKPVQYQQHLASLGHMCGWSWYAFRSTLWYDNSQSDPQIVR